MVPPPDMFLTYMNADTPRLCANEAGVHHLNSVHGVYLRESRRAVGAKLLPLASLNSMTLLGAEIVGRAYGGGMLKLEPKEADKLPLPSASLLEAAAADLESVRSGVAFYLERRDLASAVRLVDEVLLGRLVGIRPEDLRALRDARDALYQRRTARGPDPRDLPQRVLPAEAGVNPNGAGD